MNSCEVGAGDPPDLQVRKLLLRLSGEHRALPEELFSRLRWGPPPQGMCGSAWRCSNGGISDQLMGARGMLGAGSLPWISQKPRV